MAGLVASAKRSLDTLAGLEMTDLWVDECSSINPLHMETIASAPELRVKPINVPCTHCGAPAGKGCLPLAAYDWLAMSGGTHVTRHHDAKVVSDALDALDPLPVSGSFQSLIHYGCKVLSPRSVVLVDSA